VYDLCGWHRTDFADYDQGMRRLMSLILVTVIAAPLAGCIVATGPARGGPVARSCPPAHHWEGGACVHNGRARGHYK